MPKVKQLSAWVEDRPGMIGQIADALGQAKVNIRAFSASVMDGHGFVRVVVDKVSTAKRVFRKHGWETTQDDLVVATMPDKPGALGRVADKLGAAGVNIEYGYVGPGPRARTVNLYLSVQDPRAALKALR